MDASTIGRVSFFDFFYRDDRSIVERDLFPRALREGHAEKEIRVRHQQTGDPMWMMCSVVLLRDSVRQPVGLRGNRPRCDGVEADRGPAA